MFIPVILGTAREGRNSEQVAHFIQEQVTNDQIDTTLIDVKQYVTHPQTIPDWQDPTGETSKWLEIVEKADGFIVVLPEYNHGYPGELKLLLDQVSAAYAHKPVAVVGVSKGDFGGARIIEHCYMLWKGLGLVHVANVYTPQVETLFSSDSHEPSDLVYKERVQAMIKELRVYAKGLAVIREELSS